jgi:hypothetical protein
MRLARSRDGRTIHQDDCRYARIPWEWALDRKWEHSYNTIITMLNNTAQTAPSATQSYTSSGGSNYSYRSAIVEVRQH